MLIRIFYICSGVFFLLLNNCIPLINGANILGLLGMTSPSNQIWNTVLLYRLAELGHNVTILSVDKPKSNEKLPANVHQIYLEKGYSMYDKDQNEKMLDISSIIGLNPFEMITPFYAFGVGTCNGIVASKGFQTLLNYPDDFQFDLILNDYTLGPYLLGFVHKFKYPPLVGLTAFHNPPNTIDAMMNHYFPAYIPYHSTTYSTEMNFWQRFVNTLLFMADTAYRRLIYLPRIDAIMRPYFTKDMPYLGDLDKHTALSLVNSHPSIDYAEPLPPNVIEVGGMQILDGRPLPKDLEEFINKSRKGVVFISFGTNIKSEDFTDKQIQVILSALSQLPEYNFMWKFDSKYIKGNVPKNVLLKTFFPQSDILAIPKVKAFVTHCGGLSSQEATWRGVPMIGIPLFLDQHRNLRQSMLAGVAEKIDFLTMTTDILRDTIKKVAEDPKMAKNVRIRSALFRDQPMKPLDRAVWWMEYLLRNPNPYHLKSPASKLNIFQSNSLDVILMMWTIFLLLMYILGLVVIPKMKWIKIKIESSLNHTFRKRRVSRVHFNLPEGLDESERSNKEWTSAVSREKKIEWTMVAKKKR